MATFDPPSFDPSIELQIVKGDGSVRYPNTSRWYNELIYSSLPLETIGNTQGTITLNGMPLDIVFWFTNVVLAYTEYTINPQELNVLEITDPDSGDVYIFRDLTMTFAFGGSRSAPRLTELTSLDAVDPNSIIPLFATTLLVSDVILYVEGSDGYVDGSTLDVSPSGVYTIGAVLDKPKLPGTNTFNLVRINTNSNETQSLINWDAEYPSLSLEQSKRNNDVKVTREDVWVVQRLDNAASMKIAQSYIGLRNLKADRLISIDLVALGVNWTTNSEDVPWDEFKIVVENIAEQLVSVGAQCRALVFAGNWPQHGKTPVPNLMSTSTVIPQFWNYFYDADRFGASIVGSQFNTDFDPDWDEDTKNEFYFQYAVKSRSCAIYALDSDQIEIRIPEADDFEYQSNKGGYRFLKTVGRTFPRMVSSFPSGRNDLAVDQAIQRMIDAIEAEEEGWDDFGNVLLNNVTGAASAASSTFLGQYYQDDRLPREKLFHDNASTSGFEYGAIKDVYPPLGYFQETQGQPQGVLGKSQELNFELLAGGDIGFRMTGGKSYYSPVFTIERVEDFDYRKGAIYVASQSYGSTPAPQIGVEADYRFVEDFEPGTFVQGTLNPDWDPANSKSPQWIGGNMDSNNEYQLRTKPLDPIVGTGWSVKTLALRLSGDANLSEPSVETTTYAAGGQFILRELGVIVFTVTWKDKTFNEMFLEYGQGVATNPLPAGWLFLWGRGTNGDMLLPSRAYQNFKNGCVFSFGCVVEPNVNPGTEAFIPILMQGFSIADWFLSYISFESLNSGQNTNGLALFGDPLYSPFKNTLGVISDMPNFQREETFLITDSEGVGLTGTIGYRSTGNTGSAINKTLFEGYTVDLVGVSPLGIVIRVDVNANFTKLPGFSATKDKLISCTYKGVTYPLKEGSATGQYNFDGVVDQAPVAGEDYGLIFQMDTRVFWFMAGENIAGDRIGVQIRTTFIVAPETYGYAEPYNVWPEYTPLGFDGITQSLGSALAFAEYDDGEFNGSGFPDMPPFQPYYGFAFSKQYPVLTGAWSSSAPFIDFANASVNDAITGRLVDGDFYSVWLFKSVDEYDDYFNKNFLSEAGGKDKRLSIEQDTSTSISV